jgi:hypothetical protein
MASRLFPILLWRFWTICRCRGALIQGLYRTGTVIRVVTVVMNWTWSSAGCLHFVGKTTRARRLPKPRHRAQPPQQAPLLRDSRTPHPRLSLSRATGGACRGTSPSLAHDTVTARRRVFAQRLRGSGPSARGRQRPVGRQPCNQQVEEGVGPLVVNQANVRPPQTARAGGPRRRPGRHTPSSGTSRASSNRPGPVHHAGRQRHGSPGKGLNRARCRRCTT